MSEARRGLLAMGTASCIWGLSPLLFRQLSAVAPGDVVAWRMLWTLVFFALVLGSRGRLGEIAALLRFSPLRVAGAAAMISTNWFVFVLAVQNGHAIQASLGYFIFPLVAVLLGAVVYRERLAAVQWIAVALAGLAVALLTLGLGVAPGIALILATTFGLYGLIKKGVRAGGMVSVAAEATLLAPLALFWLGGDLVSGRPLPSPGDMALLVLAGVVFTGVPLLLFSFAAQRLPMASVGLIQYLNPTLQFLVATLIFREFFTLWHAAAFGLIWLALALYSVSTLRAEAALRSSASSAGTSGTV
ncbi:EamA family transporter RarD [Tropicimonas sp. IMCC34043]|uniref:EamA family transporter RarD n=1 Tax=Tropicimonas sp. IMCC34043 TaxID=2248760 RepID=UPI000E272167|nr:EamA family transporter RarD [Tropicimonas sp. IMCC34043]